MAAIAPTSGDGRYNLLFAIARNTYTQCVNAGVAGMDATVGDSEYNLYYKIAYNTYHLAL